MSVRDELEKIKAAHGGLVTPRQVVEFARDPATALHSRFEWDDSKAGEAYRLWQARQVLRVEVTVLESVNEPIRAFVSLRADRKTGGYRALVDVLADDAMTAAMVRDAKSELTTFREKYRTIREVAELQGVFLEIDKSLSAEQDRRTAA